MTIKYNSLHKSQKISSLWNKKWQTSTKAIQMILNTISPCDRVIERTRTLKRGPLFGVITIKRRRCACVLLYPGDKFHISNIFLGWFLSFVLSACAIFPLVIYTPYAKALGFMCAVLPKSDYISILWNCLAIRFSWPFLCPFLSHTLHAFSRCCQIYKTISFSIKYSE